MDPGFIAKATAYRPLIQDAYWLRLIFHSIEHRPGEGGTRLKAQVQHFIQPAISIIFRQGQRVFCCYHPVRAWVQYAHYGDLVKLLTKHRVMLESLSCVRHLDTCNAMSKTADLAIVYSYPQKRARITQEVIVVGCHTGGSGTCPVLQPERCRFTFLKGLEVLIVHYDRPFDGHISQLIEPASQPINTKVVRGIIIDAGTVSLVFNFRASRRLRRVGLVGFRLGLVGFRLRILRRHFSYTRGVNGQAVAAVSNVILAEINEYPVVREVPVDGFINRYGSCEVLEIIGNG